MEPFILNLSFVAAAADWRQGDPDFVESAMQTCTDAYLTGAWRVANVAVTQVFVPCKTLVPEGALGSPGFLIDALEVAAGVKGGLPVLTALLGTWLQGRSGRQLRLRIGAVEAEAGTAREVGRLLDRASRAHLVSRPQRHASDR